MDHTIRQIVENEIENRKTNPIDLMGLGDGSGEHSYLVRQANSYVRTVSDVASLFDKESRGSIRILEIGAYLGIVSIALAKLGFQVEAFELRDFCSNPRLRALYEENGIRLTEGDLSEYRINLEDKRFDAVIMCETLEHLNFNPLPAIRELNRITKVGGHLYIAMPNGACLQNRLRALRGESICNPIADYFQQIDTRYNMLVGLHWREYTMRETVEMLVGVGYTVANSYYFEPRDMEPQMRIRRRIGKAVRSIWPALRKDQVVIGKKLSLPDFDHWRV